MIEIECLACGKSIKPPQLNDTDKYDTDNYDGQVVCPECKALLHVKLIKGKVQKYKIIERLRLGTPIEIEVVHRDKKSS